VAELRISRGFTQEELAERLLKDRRYVQEIEGGRQWSSPEIPDRLLMITPRADLNWPAQS
jgi:transcriptional regulator with XRE-family HTH domain